MVFATENKNSVFCVFTFVAVFYGLDTLTVVGIAFAAFVIGALLTGALWFIYSHTGKHEGSYSAETWCSLHSCKVGGNGRWASSGCPGLFFFFFLTLCSY